MKDINVTYNELDICRQMEKTIESEVKDWKKIAAKRYDIAVSLAKQVSAQDSIIALKEDMNDFYTARLKQKDNQITWLKSQRFILFVATIFLTGAVLIK